MKYIKKIANKLSRFPLIKKVLKLIYQFLGVLFSDKKTIPDSITAVGDSTYENLFGYYDKSPWNKDGDMMIYLRTEDASKNVAPRKPAKIILKNLNKNTEKVIAETKAWNVQQGAMLQWLGPDYNTRIIYNDYRDDTFCSIILDIATLNEKVLNSPVYSVSSKGDFAITLDFSRLHYLRPGYGYSNIKLNKIVNIPKGYCIWKVDFETNKKIGILEYKDLCRFNIKSMKNAFHKVNHIMLNPTNDRFIFLHRWINKGVKKDSLYSVDINGSNLFLLMDDGMVSHSNWKDKNTIISYGRDKNEGDNFFILKDKSKKKEVLNEFFKNSDGHPSYSPDLKKIVIDSYPDFSRKQHIYIVDAETKEVKEMCSIYSNFKYIGNTRCDLHPRWKWDSKEIAFDGSQHSKRNIYKIILSEDE